MFQAPHPRKKRIRDALKVEPEIPRHCKVPQRSRNLTH